jgi:hypothetical protein
VGSERRTIRLRSRVLAAGGVQVIAPPRPGSDRFRLLALIVNYPGELDTRQLAAHLWPPQKLPPPVDLADIRARQKARDEANKAAQAKASAMLHQLGRKGLICGCGSPEVSRWFHDRLKSRGMAEAIRRAHPEWPGKVPPLEQHISMVWRLVDGVPTMADLLGKRPSGQIKQVYRDLCAWGVIVPPSYRWPTEAGIALVNGTNTSEE